MAIKTCLISNRSNLTYIIMAKSIYWFIRLMEQAKDFPALQFNIDKREVEREITSNNVKVTRTHKYAQFAPDTKHMHTNTELTILQFHTRKVNQIS
jgi:hypothetical protein